MSLDAVRALDTNNLAIQTLPIFEKWQDCPASRISHHGQICCEIAREWLFSMDFSQLNGSSILTGPRWLRQRYNWGPSRWAIYWCEAVRQKTLDCGALAHLAQEVFAWRGVKSFPVQLVQQFSKEATIQWAKKWDGEEISAYWIKEDLIYHEGCAVLVGENNIRIWDASAAWWINPKQNSGYGSLRALRLFAAESQLPAVFNWGKHQIFANKWQEIKD